MKRVHFIGVGGTAMATLAAMLKARGADVQGSDHAIYPPMSDVLAHEGIRVLDGYRAEHITPDLDLVVVGNAVSRGNPEVEAVLTRKVRFASLPETIRDEFLWRSHSIVVSGTHGKTTTTSLVGWLLTSGGRDPTVLIGGVATNFEGSYRLGRGREFVIEGDEYDSAFFDKTAKFLKYLPDIAIVNNLEYDHADIYPDLESLRIAFRRLVGLVPRDGLVLLGIDSPEARALAAVARSPVETFATAVEADWQAGRIRVEGGRTHFEVLLRGARFGSFDMSLLGEHNVRNALAAIAVSHRAGVAVRPLQDGMASFAGVRRRLELRGTANGVAVYDDFAHHPTAIFETLRAMRSAHPSQRLWAVFEPRSATSCRRIFQADFARAFADAGADEIVLAPVFRSSLPDDARLSIDDLVKDVSRAGGRIRALPDVATIVQTIAAEARAGDLVVIMSNGAFDGIHQKLLNALGGFDRPS